MSILDQLRAGAVTGSGAETQALAAELAAALPPDATLALHGDLGAGKTTFVQGLARGFGVQEPVTSPTFNLFSIYRGRRTLVHLDAYRLHSGRELETLMLDDFLASPWCLAVEWPETVSDWLPADAWHLTLTIESGGSHRIALK